MTIAGALVTAFGWFTTARQSPVRQESAADHGPFHVVTAEPLFTKATIKGTIAAGRTVPVIAPFDGRIREKRVQVGDPIDAGDVLVTMETFEIETRLRDAQAASLRTAMALDQLAHWSDSSEVLRARRAIDSAETSLSKLERQVAEAKGLFERGIISRNEYEGLLEQRDAQLIGRVSARDDLRAAVARGDANNRRLAELENSNAKLRLSELQQQFDGAVVRAAVSGIVMRPPIVVGPPATSMASIEPGVRVARGQCLFVIADGNALVVLGKADESDVNALRVGMDVDVESDAFPGDPIPGRLISVSAEADSGQTGKAPSFEVRASLTGIGETRRAAIRIGMSARMSIVLRANPKAIQVPITAIRNASKAPIVRVLGSRIGEVIERRVTLGPTAELGVEILSGLDVGERILLRW